VPTRDVITALLYVQHLLGIGHLMRAGALAGGLEAGGIRVVLVSGGMPVSVLDSGAGRFEQLTPVRATDESFKTLVDEADEPISEAWKARRRQRLLTLLDEVRPDILITELYPFGRRQMRFELDTMLERARSMRAPMTAPLIVSSVRDILVASDKKGRSDEVIACIRRFYDLVLVHGDEDVVPFERSFARAAEIADRIHSTGYVIRPMPARQGPGAPGFDEVIVSAGGGAVGDELLRAAIEARASSSLCDRIWRVLVGHNHPEDGFRALESGAPPGVVVERARDDFPQLLANCAVSISQGGYNTVTEILAAGVRAVCVPFAGGRESEQKLRCRLLAERGLLQMVEHDAVSPGQIARAVDRAVTLPLDPVCRVNTDGAGCSAALLREAVLARRAGER